MKRLIKKNNTNIEFGRPGGLLFPQYDQKIENDTINNMHYGPNDYISWDFEKNLDNSEWNLQK